MGALVGSFDFWPFGAAAGVLIAVALNRAKARSEALAIEVSRLGADVQALKEAAQEQQARYDALERSFDSTTAFREDVEVAPSVSSETSARTLSVLESTTATSPGPEPKERSGEQEESVEEKSRSTPADEMPVLAPSAPTRNSVPAPTPQLPPKATPSADPIERALLGIKELIFGGNTVVRVGILVLLVGVTLLLKYAAENSKLPLELRMAGAGLLGVGLVVAGVRQRRQRKGFADALQGGGVATMYLVVFFSYRVYDLLPSPLSFGLLVCIAGLSATLAVVQDAKFLAVAGQVGGFLAPLLASSGSGNHVGLFSYYLLLNLSIAGIAWFRPWRELNLVGFIFTFGIGAAWGGLNYSPEHFATTEPFLISFYLLYVLIPVLFAARGRAKGWVDGSLVFGAPLAFVGLQLLLVKAMPFAMAFTTVLMAALYLSLVRVLQRPAFAEFGAMRSSFIALAIGFITLAIPYGLDDSQLSSATWAIEGAGIYFLGVRQQRWFSRFAGVALQVIAGLAIAWHGLAQQASVHALPLIHGPVLAAGFLFLACLFVAEHANRNRSGSPAAEGSEAPLSAKQPAAVSLGESRLVQGLIPWGLFFLVVQLHTEFVRIIAPEWLLTVEISTLSVLGILLELLGAKRSWPAVRFVPLSLVPLLLPLALISLVASSEPLLAYGGTVAWSLYFASLYLSLRRFVPTLSKGWHYLHPTFLWSACIWCSLSLFGIGRELFGLNQVWLSALVGLPLLGMLVVLTRFEAKAFWPLSSNRDLYLGLGRPGLVFMLLLLVMLLNLFSSGDDKLLGYVPLLNPGELFQWAALLVVFQWARREGAPLRFTAADVVRGAQYLIALLAFLSWNGMLARSMHRFAGVPWDAYALWEFGPLQVGFAVSWAVIGLAVTGIASRTRVRALWVVGACLLAAVVVKLFLLDLDKLAAVPKIITFLAVGFLLVLVGYFSPVPPKEEQS